MVIVIIIMAVLIIALMFVMFTKLTLTLTITYVDHRQDIYMRLSWLKQTIIKRTIPLIELDDHLSMNVVEKDQVFQHHGTEKKKHYNTDDLKREWTVVDKMIDLKQDVLPRVKQLMQKIHVQQFNWMSEIGTSKADHTATLVGMAYGFKSVICHTVARFLTVTKPLQYDVSPNYQTKTVRTNATCIMSIRIGHIICDGLSIAWQYQKLKRWYKNERTSYS
ncbi:hypothetical protein ABID56_000729 [Alkalibacillus flavidus]|uniref:DUF2953 domain-containing protein n=1 Tax=Alkalibacillus flavidus TaxID=546021 RepID=A0ABV2KSU5_9BACI